MTKTTLLTAAGFVALVATIFAVISALLYKFFDRLTAAGRMDALVIMAWLIPVAFLIGIGVCLAYIKGFKQGTQQVTPIGSLRSDRPAGSVTILEPRDRLPAEFAAVSPDFNDRILRALRSGEDEAHA